MKYCNPDTCSECLYIGEGDSICEISHELVLDNWQSVRHTIPLFLQGRLFTGIMETEAMVFEGVQNGGV